jgi:hypothetical protein
VFEFPPPPPNIVPSMWHLANIYSSFCGPVSFCLQCLLLINLFFDTIVVICEV